MLLLSVCLFFLKAGEKKPEIQALMTVYITVTGFGRRPYPELLPFNSCILIINSLNELIDILIYSKAHQFQLGSIWILAYYLPISSLLS